MGSRAERDEVYDLIASLEPVMLRRVWMAQRRPPVTLPDELLLLESVIVLRKDLRAKTLGSIRGIPGGGAMNPMHG